jgi:hypothetical protein
LIAAIGENQLSEWQNGTIQEFVKPKKSVFVAQEKLETKAIEKRE